MTVRVFVSGQSNALGRGTGGPDWSGIDSRVRVWNNVNPLGSNGTAFGSAATARAAGTFENFTTNNLAVWFCSHLAQRLDDDVDMTIVAKGATGISEWGDGQDMLLESDAVWTATGQDPAHVFVWHQGEANAASPSSYKTSFLALLDNLEAAGVIDASTIVIVGGLAEESQSRIDFNRDILQSLAAENVRIFYASSNGLATYDGTHFTGQMLHTFGYDRYFHAYMEALNAMPDLWALVNEGGTPGEAGTGENKIVNINPILNSGYRLKGPAQVLTTTQTYNTPSDVAAILVEVQGSGGGGAGASSASSAARMGGGGGAGGYAAKFIESPDASYAVTIGAAGTGGASGQNNGGAGGTTSFGSVSATGGSGGGAFGSTAEPYMTTGGNAGLGSGGDVNSAGDGGGIGFKMSSALRQAGAGGTSRFGRGGTTTLTGSAATVTNGNAGSGYGAGGGGGTCSDSANASGGDGNPGVVLVWEYLKG
ncbi:MAG: sialate O-acetylesterase [Rhizobiaceae bacterium]|nr:sialate O-acetylesterase [Rhizobiaceae bacterium]MCV0406316.1 sialate O-acetylesterase [Rhizobiaceae bacterium]